MVPLCGSTRSVFEVVLASSVHSTETEGSLSLAPKMALPVSNPCDWTVNTGQHKGLRFSSAFSCVLKIVQNLDSVKKGQVTFGLGMLENRYSRGTNAKESTLKFNNNILPSSLDGSWILFFPGRHFRGKKILQIYYYETATVILTVSCLWYF